MIRVFVGELEAGRRELVERDRRASVDDPFLGGVEQLRQAGFDCRLSPDPCALLRQALIAGQASADRAATWLLRATWVLVALTIVLVILTGVLLNRPGA